MSLYVLYAHKSIEYGDYYGIVVFCRFVY